MTQNRWLLVEFISATPSLAQAPHTNTVDAKKIYSVLKQSILTNFGDSGWGAVSFSLTGQHDPMSILSAFANLLCFSEILFAYDKCCHHTGGER